MTILYTIQMILIAGLGACLLHLQKKLRDLREAHVNDYRMINERVSDYDQYASKSIQDHLKWHEAREVRIRRALCEVVDALTDNGHRAKLPPGPTSGDEVIYTDSAGEEHAGIISRMMDGVAEIALMNHARAAFVKYDPNGGPGHPHTWRRR